MPYDAASRSTFIIRDGPYNDDSVTVLVYQSRSLGRILQALNFQDCQGAMLPAGTFFLDPHKPYDSGWTLGVGSCPN